jgi:hypothetical protein
MIRLPQSKRLTAELTLIRMADASLDTSEEALLSRIAALEDRIALLESGAPAQPLRQPPLPAPAVSRPDGTESEPEDGPAEKPAAPRTPQIPETEGEPVPADLSEVIERCRSQIPGCAGHLMECDCFVSPDGKKITIRTAGEFARTMLSAPNNLGALTSVLRLCGIGAPGASVEITAGAKPKEKRAVDELQDY